MRSKINHIVNKSVSIEEHLHLDSHPEDVVLGPDEGN